MLGVLGQPHCLQALDVGSEQSAILGFSELTVNKKLQCAVSGLTASHMGGKKKREIPLTVLRLLSVPPGTSSVWLP